MRNSLVDYHDRILGPVLGRRPEDAPVQDAIDAFVEYRRLPIDDRLDNHFAELARAPWYSRLWEWLR